MKRIFSRRPVISFPLPVTFLIAFLSVSVPEYCVFAQTAADPDFNEVSGTVIDSLTRESLPGAVVTVINLNGSAHCTTDKDGKFKITFFKGGDIVRVEIAMLGYGIVKKDFPAARNIIEMGVIPLQEDPDELDAAIVEGRNLLFKASGDTLLFFPSSLLSGQTVTALDALAQMPGVTVTDDAVAVGGKYIERTYVNGKLVFGKGDPMAALKNIYAKDIAAILAYDELDEESEMLYGENAEKRRVLNVVTFDLFSQSLIAAVKASGGADLQEDIGGKYTGRYLAGAGVQFYSERRQLVLDYLGNNIGDFKHSVYQQNTYAPSDPGEYKVTNKAVAQYSDKIGDKWDISGKYGYDDALVRTGRILQSDYFGTADLPARTYKDSTMKTDFEGVHSASVRLSHMGRNSYLKAGLRSSWSNSRVTDVASTFFLTEENVSSRTSVDNYGERKLYGGGADMTYGVNIGKGSVSADLKADFGDDRLDRTQGEYREEQSGGRTVHIVGSGRNRNLGGNLTYGIRVGKGHLSWTYGAKYDYDRKYHLAKDEFTGKVDSTLSRDYTDDFLTNLGKMAYRLSAGKFSLRAEACYENRRVRRDDAISDMAWSRKSFNSILPSLDLMYSFRAATDIRLRYYTSVSTPSLEHLSDRLDYDNPMYLHAGNQNLSQGYSHNFSFSGSFSDPETQIFANAGITCSIRKGIIGTRSVYFDKDTYLPQYRYTASSGATLVTYENLDGARTFSVNGAVNALIPFIRCTGGLQCSYMYDRQPMYIGENLATAIRHTPSAKVSLKSNFSRNIGFSAEYGILYTSGSSVGEHTYSSLQNSLDVSLRADFLKRMYAAAEYDMYCDYSYTLSGVQLSANRLSLTLGLRIFRGELGDISISVYDLLNDDASFSQEIYADRISRTWTSRTPRFAVLSFKYKFQRNR